MVVSGTITLNTTASGGRNWAPVHVHASTMTQSGCVSKSSAMASSRFSRSASARCINDWMTLLRSPVGTISLNLRGTSGAMVKEGRKATTKI